MPGRQTHPSTRGSFLGPRGWQGCQEGRFVLLTHEVRGEDRGVGSGHQGEVEKGGREHPRHQGQYDLEGRVLKVGPFEASPSRPAVSEAALSLQGELADLDKLVAAKQEQLRILQGQAPSSAGAQAPLPTGKNKAACTFYNQGHCSMGAACTHAHVCWYCRDANNHHPWYE